MLRSIRCLAGTFAVAAALIAAGASASHAQSLPASATAGEERARLLRPGDLIRLRIWREPDLSGDFLVDVDGIIVFPMIGPYQVTNESPESLKEKLVTAYQEYLRNPSIDVLPMRRVNILGAVRSPGLYPIDATMTLADALALAGGATPQGDPNEVELVRNGERVTARLSGDTRVGELPIRSGDQLFVPERSWVSRNSGIVAATISATVSLAIALINIYR